MIGSVRLLAGYSIGAIVGAGVSYWFTRKSLEDEFESRLERELEETREFYKILHKRGEYATLESEESPEKDIPDQDEELMETYLDEVTVYSAAVNNEPDEIRRFERITEQAAEENLEGYDEVSLTFFREDGYLANEDGSAISTPTEVVGKELLEELENEPEDTEQAFIRDNQNRVNYFIDLEKSSYHSTILKHMHTRMRDHRKTPRFRMYDE